MLSEQLNHSPNVYEVTTKAGLTTVRANVVREFSSSRVELAGGDAMWLTGLSRRERLSVYGQIRVADEKARKDEWTRAQKARIQALLAQLRPQANMAANMTANTPCPA